MGKSIERGSGFAQTAAIWLLVFCAGWFVMLTELVGARVLSPYFGNTIYVWGSVIGIFLLAMAVGYAIGGRWTKHSTSPLVPVLFVAAAGIYVAGTQLCADRLCASLYALHLDARWGALVGASVLYGLPMVLLGGISPYCVHLATRARLDVGHRAGILYAVSTIGSFVGCIVTAFVLIPGFPLWNITIGGGLLLALVASLVGLILTDHPIPATIIVMVMSAGLAVSAGRNSGKIWHTEKKAFEYSAAGVSFSKASTKELKPLWDQDAARAQSAAAKLRDSDRKILWEKETAYHRITILQEGSRREMIFGKADFHYPQSQINMKDINWPVDEYTRLAFASMLYKPNPKRICVIGIGGAIVPRLLEQYAPDAKIDAIDIDSSVVEAARKYFYWRPSRNVTVYVQDGRSFLNWVLTSGGPRYDLIFVDAYCDEYIPFHLTTEEFMSTVKRVLTPDGVMTANVFIDSDFYGCEARTLNKVFGNVNAFVGSSSGNVILVSQNGRTEPLSAGEAALRMKKVNTAAKVRIDYRDIVGSLWNGQNWSSKGPILTDMWSPVESLVR